MELRRHIGQRLGGAPGIPPPGQPVRHGILRHLRHAMVGRDEEQIAVLPEPGIQEPEEGFEFPVQPQVGVLDLYGIGAKLVPDVIGRG